MLAVLALSGCDGHKKLPEAVAQSNLYQHIDWGMLTPPNWDAMLLLKGLNLEKMQDSDPRAAQAMKKIREQWQTAPVVANMDGKHVTITGYVAPLDSDLEHVREFLLVPYFGACIHTPPPPSNQIVHVHISGPPISLLGWDANVTVSGVIETIPSVTEVGTSGYGMTADLVAPFKNEFE